MLSNKRLQETIDFSFLAYDRKDSPGCAVGIVQHGELVFKKGYGMANLEYEVPITPRTVFCLASLAKQFTAMCIALLEEDGRLALTDDIRKYLPQFPGYGHRITIGSLIYHTSGIRDYYIQALSMMGVKLNDFLTEDEALQILLAQRGLIFPPGTRFHYSNSNYLLLSLIVKQVTGESIGQFSQKHIFAPLKMQHTFYRENHSQIIKNRAVAYGEYPLRNGSPRQYLPAQDAELHYILTTDSELTGDDGVWSTIEDLYLWDQNFYANRLGQGRQELIERCLTPGRLIDGSSTAYAFGQVIGTTDGHAVVEHSGWVNGYLSVLERYPQDQAAIILLSNTNRLIPWTFTPEIRKCLLDLPEQSVHTTGSITTYEADGSSSLAVVGSYICPENASIWQISHLDDHWQILANGIEKIALAPCEKDVFEVVGEGLHLRVLYDENGKKVSLHVSNSERAWMFLPFPSEEVATQPLQAYEGTYCCEELRTTFDTRLENGKLCLRNHNRHRCGLDLAFEPTTKDLFYTLDPSVDCVVLEFLRGADQSIQAFVFRSPNKDGREQLKFMKQQ